MVTVVLIVPPQQSHHLMLSMMPLFRLAESPDQP